MKSIISFSYLCAFVLLMTSCTADLATQEEDVTPIAPNLLGLVSGVYSEAQSFTLDPVTDEKAHLEYSIDDEASWHDYQAAAVTLSANGQYVVKARKIIISDGGTQILKSEGAEVIVNSAITVNPQIAPGMVLQRNASVVLNGTCVDTNAQIQIQFDDQTQPAPCVDGLWQATFTTGEAGGPYAIDFTVNDDEFRIGSVYVGDVWFVAGQSNSMDEGDFISVTPAPANVIRLFDYQYDNFADSSHYWQDFSNASAYSKLGGYFAYYLQQDINVPIGVIAVGKSGTQQNCWDTNRVCYVNQVQPFQDYPIKGVLWWQGEANTNIEDTLSRPIDVFASDFANLVRYWRIDWNIPDLPFIEIQLERFLQDETLNIEDNNATYADSYWPRVRQGQLDGYREISDTAAAMVVSFDLTDGNIHPEDKRAIVQRAVLAAEAKAYGVDVSYSGPLYDSITRSGNELRISFTHTDGGLVLPEAGLQDFEVVDASGSVLAVTPTIEGVQVVIDLALLTRFSYPVTVRYAYKMYPLGNLYNGAGLPASPFESEPIN